AGKTTTVEILEGYRRRDAGEVTVLGVDPARADRLWRSRIGLVLQSGSVADELTVHETVTHFANYYPRPRPSDGVIAAVGLEEKRDARLTTLSGGQRRRLDVALGLIGDPELLFLDEPTTGFDPEARRQFWDLIRSLRAGGTTILLTTHYLDEAEALADRVGVLVGGRLVEVASPALLGGRADSKVHVTWTEPDGTKREEVTDTPTAVVTELATRFNGEIPDLSVQRSTLDDVYLRMIGANP
ncbi:MAG: type transport system ATP-binding protein, partial [Acidimicrobiaceae bacterium]|nr:type transport system ATP-binding protein [Acidimicrobiaceae bacterium]